MVTVVNIVLCVLFSILFLRLLSFFIGVFLLGFLEIFIFLFLIFVFFKRIVFMIFFEGMFCIVVFGFFFMIGGGGVLGFFTGVDIFGVGGVGGGGGGVGGVGGVLGGFGFEDFVIVEYKGFLDFIDEVLKFFMLKFIFNFLLDKGLYFIFTFCFIGFGRGEGGL